MIGQTISSYRVLEKIGEGGMGQVYLAEDRRLGRRVALKVLPPDLARDRERCDRFEREGRAASALNHPNIAHVYDVGEDGGVPFIAMEYVEGESLRARIARGALSTEEFLDIALQIASALEEASSRGVVHRDLKPANIVITPRGQVKVLDFGLAKLTGSAQASSGSDLSTELKTEAGVVMGTVQYMSPEQALARGVDARSDLFSFGVILYEMATGRSPFGGGSVTEIIDRIVHAAPDAVARYNYDVSPELERILKKCLEKDRERRFQTARDLRIDLENLVRDRQSRPGAVAAPPPRAKKRAAAVVLGVALAVTLIAALVSVVTVDRSEASIDTLAVVPFKNGTGDPEVEYLTDGISESLINSLCQIPDLKVTSRSSAFVFKNTTDGPKEIAEKLGVQALLLGTLALQGDTVSISAELVDVGENRQLWGERYRRPADDLATIEEEITRTIASTLRAKLTGEEANRLVHRHTDDPESYRLYLKGRQSMVGTFEEMDRAIEYFQQAIEREPLYALAHAGLAEAYTIQAYLRWNGREETARRARAEAEKAVEIDGSLAEAHAVSGMVKLYFDWDWKGAEERLRRAVEINPGSAIAYEEYTNVLMILGKLGPAEEAGLKAAELDPLDVLPTHQLGILYMFQRRYEDAAAQFQRAQELRPAWVWGYIKRAKALAHLEKFPEALAEAERGEAILGQSDNPIARAWLGFTYALAGQEDRAREVLRRMEELSRMEYVDPSAFAMVHAGLGEVDATASRLVEAFEDHSPYMVYANSFPEFYSIEALARDPRFLDILERMSFPR